MTICKECDKPRMAKNRERYVERFGSAAYREAQIDRARAYRIENQERCRDLRIAWRKRQREQLTDAYLLKLICERSPNLKPEHIPKTLIEVKRAHLILSRAVYQLEDESNEECN